MFHNLILRNLNRCTFSWLVARTANFVSLNVVLVVAVCIHTDPEFVNTTLVDYFKLRRIYFRLFGIGNGFAIRTRECFTSILGSISFLAFVAVPVLFFVFVILSGRFRIRKIGHVLNFIFFWLVWN